MFVWRMCLGPNYIATLVEVWSGHSTRFLRWRYAFWFHAISAQSSSVPTRWARPFQRRERKCRFFTAPNILERILQHQQISLKYLSAAYFSAACLSAYNVSAKNVSLNFLSATYLSAAAGASAGILVWYGQPSEVQFPRGGEMAEPKILEI